MGLLEYGMRHEKSDSRLQRRMARAALAVEKKRADLYEMYLNKKKITFPDDPGEAAILLQKIKDQIKRQKSG